MDDEISLNKSVFITCPDCSRQNRVEAHSLGEIGSFNCLFCESEIVSTNEKPSPIEMKSTDFLEEEPRGQYVYGAHSKKRKRLSTFFALVNISILITAVFFLGVGKINDTYVVGVKKRPGLKKMYVNSGQTSVSGRYIIDRKIRRDFSYVVVRYSKESGLAFFQEV